MSRLSIIRTIAHTVAQWVKYRRCIGLLGTPKHPATGCPCRHHRAAKPRPATVQDGHPRQQEKTADASGHHQPIPSRS